MANKIKVFFLKDIDNIYVYYQFIVIQLFNILFKN